MALTRTTEQLVEAVQRTANVLAFTDRHPVAYIRDLLNRGLGALNRVTAIVNPEFRPIASTPISTDGVNTVFSLPSNFRSLLSVEYTDADGKKTWLLPYELHERASLTEAMTRDGSTRAHGYRLLGANIELLPLPPDGHTALVWYATTAPQLAALQSVDVYDRLDDFIVWWAAREIAMDRDDWERHDRLTAKIDSLVADIQIVARQRDASHPARPVNTTRHADRYGRVSRRGWG